MTQMDETAIVYHGNGRYLEVHCLAIDVAFITTLVSRINESGVGSGLRDYMASLADSIDRYLSVYTNGSVK